jgi:DNA repair protein RecN (Recombination protein N)
MMAIKIALSSQKLAVTCMIFDEIDSGIGGNTAFFIGEKLFELSRNGQVICITHLPQIACFADHHFVVDKTVIDDKTKVSVKKITDNEVIAEIVRMLSGEEAIASAIEHARELVEVAASKKMHISNCTTIAQV